MYKKATNPWKPNDEKEHSSSVIEWWCAEGFLKNIKNKRSWTFKGSFTEWHSGNNKVGMNTNLTLFDLDDKSHTCHYLRDDTRKLDIIEKPFKIKFKDTFIEGKYPLYKMMFKDPKNKIEIYLKYNSNSLPHWVTQDISNGYLPMGLGFYRYGFIPRNDLTGKLKIKDEVFDIRGEGYFEHVWGDFSYTNPLTNISGLKKSISTYSKLIGWWIKNHNPKIPNSLMFSIENNPLGYDWIWAILDNGWSIFYGNILFFVMKGPITGSLILTKDGKSYTEFCNVSFEYTKKEYSKEYDIYYPTEIKTVAKKGKEKLVLNFKNNNKISKLISPIKNKSFWKAFIIYEEPGEVSGFYKNGEKKIPLNGKCKIEPQRQISKIGHNSIKLDFIKPPKGVGIDIDFNSHYLKKRIKTNIKFTPLPHFKFNCKKIK